MDRDYIARDTGVAFSNDCMSQHCCRANLLQGDKACALQES